MSETEKVLKKETYLVFAPWNWWFHVPRPSSCCAKTVRSVAGLQGWLWPCGNQTMSTPPGASQETAQISGRVIATPSAAGEGGDLAEISVCWQAQSLNLLLFIPVSLSTNSMRSSKDRTQETEPGINQISYVTLDDQKATSVGWRKQVEGWTEDAGWNS